MYVHREGGRHVRRHDRQSLLSISACSELPIKYFFSSHRFGSITYATVIFAISNGWTILKEYHICLHTPFPAAAALRGTALCCICIWSREVDRGSWLHTASFNCASCTTNQFTVNLAVKIGLLDVSGHCYTQEYVTTASLQMFPFGTLLISS